jgi:transketolase
MGIEELKSLARKIRARAVWMSYVGDSPHLGSQLSCVDLMVAAYFSALRIDPQNAADPDRDRFILSKGHAAPALYAVLAERGFFSQELIEHYNEDGGRLPEQPSPGSVPGLEAATGSLGHGLPIGVGMAIAGKIAKRNYRVFVVLSDGECNEGSVWEAAMYAPAQKLENLIVLVDFNRWQATGRSEEVMAIQPLADKWRSFGWNAREIDGNDMKQVVEAMSNVPDGSGKPIAIVANTIKGKGVSFMEDDNNWHYRVPSAEEVKKAWQLLGQPEPVLPKKSGSRH